MCEEALKDAGYNISQIDEVILVEVLPVSPGTGDC